jgi:hypothetical protein
MKVTNLETSKKLKELGFKAETNFYWELDYYNGGNSVGCWFKRPANQMPDFEYIPAYDLETILDTLPKFLEGNEGGEFNNHPLVLDVGYGQIYYDVDFGKTIKLLVDKEENESLADTVARLLIKLLEDNIIKLGE